jgi:chromosome segregation ATPase
MNRPREHSWSGSRTRPRPVKRRRSCNSLPTPRLSSVPPQRSTSFPGLLASSEDSRSRRRRLRPALGHWPSPHSKDLGRINDAETARARAEDTMVGLSARLQEAERELERTQARTVTSENKLADAEHRVRSAEARAIQAEKAVTQIDDAIRTQLLGLQRNLTNGRAMSNTDPRSSRSGDVRQAVG